ncbi:glycoprotein L [Saguinine gammaherpesvirus 1]|uniref:Glycoprotein L n=1 Tax=Saguinine gammaherpesvirus 1 TaxID=2169901 RepID=A0A9Q8QXV8_9GAMA|nr:glycoprotein L [Saguinine gammaherpesvirus 1]
MKAFTFPLLCILVVLNVSYSQIAHPQPCCDVVDLQSKNNLVSIFKIDKIYVPHLQTCSRIFVVQTTSKKKKQ